MRSWICATGFALVGCATGSLYDQAPEMPNNQFPPIGENLIKGQEASFVWQPAIDATHYDFHIFDRTTGDIEGHAQRGLRADDVCDLVANECRVDLYIDLPVLDDHAWRVRGSNSAGFSPWTRSIFNVVETTSR